MHPYRQSTSHYISQPAVHKADGYFGGFIAGYCSKCGKFEKMSLGICPR
jgi:hypothetical protein